MLQYLQLAIWHVTMTEVGVYIVGDKKFKIIICGDVVIEFLIGKDGTL